MRPPWCPAPAQYGGPLQRGAATSCAGARSALLRCPPCAGFRRPDHRPACAWRPALRIRKAGRVTPERWRISFAPPQLLHECLPCLPVKLRNCVASRNRALGCKMPDFVRIVIAASNFGRRACDHVSVNDSKNGIVDMSMLPRGANPLPTRNWAVHVVRAADDGLKDYLENGREIRSYKCRRFANSLCPSFLVRSIWAANG